MVAADVRPGGQPDRPPHLQRRRLGGQGAPRSTWVVTQLPAVGDRRRRSARRARGRRARPRSSRRRRGRWWRSADGRPGAYVGAAVVSTAVLITGPRASASRCSSRAVVGGSGAVCQKVVSAFIGGVGSPVRAAAAGGSVATTTAAPVTSPPSVSHRGAADPADRGVEADGSLRQSGGHQLRQPGHPERRDRRRAQQEGAQQQGGEVGRGRPLPLGDDAGQEGLDHPRTQRPAELPLVQILGQGVVGAAQQPVDRAQRLDRPADEPQLVGQGAQRRGERGGQQGGLPARVGQRAAGRRRAPPGRRRRTASGRGPRGRPRASAPGRPG